MPINQRIRNTKLWLSLLPEAVYNTPYDEAAEFGALTSQNPFYLLPSIEKIDDAGNIGTGSPFATHVCNDYWTQPGVALSTQLEYFGLFGRLWLRAAGQAVVTAAQGTGFKHSSELQVEADGVQLPASDLIVKLSPLDILLAGMVVSQATLSRQRNGRPILDFNLVGSGKHESPAGIASLPAYLPPTVCGANNLIVKYTNASAVVVDLGAAGCQFVSFNVGLNNNVRLNDRCPGDPSLTENGGTALHVGRVVRTEQSLDINFAFLLNETNAEYAQHLANTNVTNVVIAIRGPLISGSDYYELGIEIPKANFRTISPSENDGDAAFALQVQPLYDATLDNVAKFYVHNITAANFR